MSRTEASGTPLARTITTAWHPVFHLPLTITEPNRITSFAYDGNGNLTRKTIAADSLNRQWNYTYNASGQVTTVNGPRTDVADITAYDYDATGNLIKITDALSHITALTYDGNGDILTITEPNGLVTTLTYDTRQRPTSRKVGDELTTYTYDAAGELVKTTSPDLSTLTFSYDAAHRLTRVGDAANNTLRYTLDLNGNILKQEVYAGGTLIRYQGAAYDALNRAATKSGGAIGETATFTYDDNGNVIAARDALGHQTTYAYDALNRRISLTNAASGTVTYNYDSNDNLLQFTDPRGLSTTYTYDGLGDLTKLASPDTGVITYAYDAAGNRRTSTDANGVTITLLYDALNRVKQQQLPGMPYTFYIYDQTTNGNAGISRLTAMSDATGGTSWTYDINGRVIDQKQSIGTGTPAILDMKWQYNSSGQLAQYTLPSGRVMSLTYDSLGNIASFGGTTRIGNIKWLPFGGPAAGWKQDNVAAYTRTYNLDWRPISIQTLGPASPPGGDTLSYSYDPAGNVSGIAATTEGTRNFTYDALNRLKSHTQGSLSETYNYDADGNRLGLSSAIGTSYGYSFAAGGNRLLSRTASDGTAQNYTYDAAGNLKSDNAFTYGYDVRNRLKTVTAIGATAGTSYAIDGFGRRVRKTAPGGASVFYSFDLGGHIVGEYTVSNGALTVKQETGWLRSMPVLVFQPGAYYFANPDNLNAPRSLTHNTGASVWSWYHDPFGTSQPVKAAWFTGYNARFPGQLWDTETGNHYNLNRDYDPTTGRYIESDPLGMAAGMNPYAYVGNNPIRGFDPFGLAAQPDNDQSYGWDIAQNFVIENLVPSSYKVIPLSKNLAENLRDGFFVINGKADHCTAQTIQGVSNISQKMLSIVEDSPFNGYVFEGYYDLSTAFQNMISRLSTPAMAYPGGPSAVTVDQNSRASTQIEMPMVVSAKKTWSEWFMSKTDPSF